MQSKKVSVINELKNPELIWLNSNLCFCKKSFFIQSIGNKATQLVGWSLPETPELPQLLAAPPPLHLVVLAAILPPASSDPVGISPKNKHTHPLL